MPDIQDVAKDAGSISGTMILLLMLCAGWLVDKFFKYKSLMKNGTGQTIDTTKPTWKEVNHQLNKKVDLHSCKEYRTRIGKESSEHGHNITQIKDCLSEIKSGISYLKGKIG